MPEYTYLLADLRTNQLLAELPLQVSSFSRVLNGVGDLTASLRLDAKVRKSDPIAATQPGRTALYVDRDGVLVWGGIIWTRRYVNRTLELGANTFGSYFAKRLITADATFTGTDQLAIARSLVETAQGKPGGNIGVTLGAETSGVLRDRTYLGRNLKPVLEAIEQLAAVENGFDFAFDVEWKDGAPAKKLSLHYPRRGRSAQSTAHVFDKPGNVVGDYAWPEDGDVLATTMHLIGETDEATDTPLRATASRPDRIDEGYPLLEQTRSYPDVSVQATLDAHAAANLDAVAEPVVLPELDVRADLEPVLGAYVEGDDVRLRFDDDDRFPDGLDTYRRILALTVTPPSPGNDERVRLTFGAPSLPQNVHPDHLGRHLDDLRRRVRGLET